MTHGGEGGRGAEGENNGEMERKYVELHKLLVLALMELGHEQGGRDKVQGGRDMVDLELARARDELMGPIWGEECATFTAEAERGGWGYRIVAIKLEGDWWMARHRMLIATNLELEATIDLLAKDSDQWQAKCMAPVKLPSNIANKRNNLAREVNVGRLTLTHVECVRN
jgi:hypothetical protein